MKRVKAYTDGACHGNPGSGGWGVVIESDGDRRELMGAQVQTTNNRMELQAAIEALLGLAEPCEIEIVTDSKYVMDGMQLWLANWKRRGWKTSQGKPVKNQDLWQKLEALAEVHRVRWHWVRGHSGVEGNERADTLAQEAIARMLIS